VANTKCRIDTDISSSDGHIVARNIKRKEINILKKNVHQVGFIYKKFINSPKRPEWLCSPASILFGVFQGPFPTRKAGGV